jgi:hypothetical protein
MKKDNKHRNRNLFQKNGPSFKLRHHYGKTIGINPEFD